MAKHTVASLAERVEALEAEVTRAHERLDAAREVIRGLKTTSAQPQRRPSKPRPVVQRNPDQPIKCYQHGESCDTRAKHLANIAAPTPEATESVPAPIEENEDLPL